ncbi:MAG: nucleotide exchange factor GrpE [Bdellovibrionaceae bacterium]|nr:nucleotide exchange factor GrpE [Pseudobdellovibrionaceae bacterium]MDW8190995.1 nucleotide exchange factor GrpE [Pseudobdellovibrionaceae bacterium]
MVEDNASQVRGYSSSNHQRDEKKDQAKDKMGEQQQSAANTNKAEEQPNDTSIQQLREELEKWKNDYLYLRAEFDNYRKHVIKERADLTKYGAERFLHDFLEIVDMMDRALATQPKPESFSSYVQGVQMIVKEVKNLLQKHGVVEENCLHQPFDPNRHEAVGSEPSTEVLPGYIVKVVKQPYRYHERLLRPGQVLVATEAKKQ